MSSEHKRPLYAFAVVALLCAFFVGSGLRSEAMDGLLRVVEIPADLNLVERTERGEIPPDRVVAAPENPASVAVPSRPAPERPALNLPGRSSVIQPALHSAPKSDTPNVSAKEQPAASDAPEKKARPGRGHGHGHGKRDSDRAPHAHPKSNHPGWKSSQRSSVGKGRGRDTHPGAGARIGAWKKESHGSARNVEKRLSKRAAVARGQQRHGWSQSRSSRPQAHRSDKKASVRSAKSFKISNRGHGRSQGKSKGSRGR